MRMKPFGSRARPAMIVVAFGILLALQADPARAQVGAALDSAVGALGNVLESAGATFSRVAQQILLVLLVVEFVYRGGKWLISGQSLGDVVEPMLYTIFIVAMAWLFASSVPSVVTGIVAEATRIAGSGGPGVETELRPSLVIDSGLDRVFEWLEHTKVMDPESWAFLVCAFIALIAVALQITMMILIYAELYLVGLGGIVTLGFAGLTQTRGIARTYVLALFAKGFKLVALFLVVDATHRIALLAEQSIRTVADSTNAMRFANVTVQGGHEPSVTVAGAMAAVLLQVIGVALVITLPGAVERLVGGTAVADVAGTGGRMVAGAAMSGGVAATGAAMGAAGGAMAGGAAAAKTAGAGAFTGGVNWPALAQGGKAALKGAAVGSLKGGVNWSQIASERGGISRELGARLSNRVNRIGSGTGSDGGGQ